MELPKYLTTVTPFSKILAIILFVLLPILGFIFGMEYKQMQIQSRPPAQIVIPTSMPLPTQTVLPTSIPTPTNVIMPKITTSPTNNLTWDECIKMPGSIILQMYPPVCNTTDGRRVTEPIKTP